MSLRYYGKHWYHSWFDKLAVFLPTVDWQLGGCCTERPVQVPHQTFPSPNCRYSSVTHVLSVCLSLLSSKNATLPAGPYLHCIVWMLFQKKKKRKGKKEKKKKAACASWRMWHMVPNGMHQWHASRRARGFLPSCQASLKLESHPKQQTRISPQIGIRMRVNHNGGKHE